MKKSFKKAGAAVLSMAMIMAMGAISMPVYAATPGSVTVSIPGAFKQGEGDSERVDQVLYNNDSAADLKYDYLDLAGVTEAKVHMYKVASLGAGGWAWEEPFRGTTQDAHPNSSEGFTTWEALLETLEIRDGDTSENKDNFTSSSADLQKLASYLERTVRNLQAVNAPGSTASDDDKTAAAQALAAIEKGTYKTLNPTNTSVTLSDPSSATMNEIGYYLLMTETDESGVIIQPVLVSLKNGKHMNASLKGTKIRVDKSIVEVSGGDDTIADTGDSAVVAKNDTVQYQIKAQIPTYDANVTAGSITPFQIIDTADPGIKLDHSNLKVYLSEDGELATTEDYLLSAGSNKDYTLTDTSDNGFTVNISGTQMLAQSNNSTLKDIKETVTVEGESVERQKYQNMEGMYVFVVVEATVNDKWTAEGVAAEVAKYKAANPSTTLTDAQIEEELGIKEGDYKFDRTYTAHKTIQDITDDDIDNVTDSDALSYINRGIYSKEELDAVANATGLQVTGNVADTLIDKVNANGDPVYLNDSNEETTDINQAKKVDGVAVRAKMVDPNGGDNLLKRVKILMARDNANAANGNTNTARMVYGNVYSTGGGSADDEDSTKLFSVDLNLTKYTQKLTLSEASTVTADNASIIAWLGLTGTPTDAQIAAALKEKADSVTTAPASTDYDSDMADAVSAMDTDPATLAAGDAAKVASLIKAYNDSLDNGYASETTKDPVQNAVFKLSKVDDPTDANSTLTEIGYAASDAQGNLKVLGTATAEQYTKYKAGTPDTEDSNKIIVKVDDTHYYWYSPDSEDAWIMLTEGTYEIEEVYAPAGYKKNTGGARFTISCAKDSVSEDYTGEFSGSSDSDLFRPLADRETTGSKPTVTFDFVGAEGELQNDMYNALADTLPATGGIGTVLFTAGGIAVVLMAGGLFVMYMKKRNSEEEE